MIVHTVVGNIFREGVIRVLKSPLRDKGRFLWPLRGIFRDPLGGILGIIKGDFWALKGDFRDP